LRAFSKKKKFVGFMPNEALTTTFPPGLLESLFSFACMLIQDVKNQTLDNVISLFVILLSLCWRLWHFFVFSLSLLPATLVELVTNYRVVTLYEKYHIEWSLFCLIALAVKLSWNYLVHKEFELMQIVIEV
jgi:hypothetical protein